jgi:hypothetical protein
MRPVSNFSLPSKIPAKFIARSDYEPHPTPQPDDTVESVSTSMPTDDTQKGIFQQLLTEDGKPWNFYGPPLQTQHQAY